MLAGSMYRKGEKVHFTAMAASPDLCALHETRIGLTTAFIQFLLAQVVSVHRPDIDILLFHKFADRSR